MIDTTVFDLWKRIFKSGKSILWPNQHKNNKMKVLIAILLVALFVTLAWSQDTAPAGSYYCFNYVRRCKGEELADDGKTDLYKHPDYLYKGEVQKVDDGYVQSYIYNKKNDTADHSDDDNDDNDDDDNNGGYSKRHVLDDDDESSKNASCEPYEIGFSLHYDAYKAHESQTEENVHLDLSIPEVRSTCQINFCIVWLQIWLLATRRSILPIWLQWKLQL